MSGDRVAYLACLCPLRCVNGHRFTGTTSFPKRNIVDAQPIPHVDRSAVAGTGNKVAPRLQWGMDGVRLGKGSVLRPQ